MQRLTIILVLFVIASCNSKNEPAGPAAENWVVAEKNRYSYKLNVFGNPDTTFLYTQKYKDGIVTDSSASFTVSKYIGGVISDEVAFLFDKNHQAKEHTVTHYEFSNGGKVSLRSITGAGKLISEEKYLYNDSNFLAKSIRIQLKPYDLLTGKQLELEGASPSSIGYDTLISIYKYDNTNKVIGTEFVNNRGVVLSNDITLYSGSDPLMTATITAKGDTAKKITYEKQDKVLMTVTETDSFVLFQNFISGIQIAQKTKYKNRNEQWRSAVKFDEKGRKIEETLYKSM